MEHITQKHLERLVDRINKTTKSPLEPYTKNGDKIKGNVGNYHLDYAYGGIKLVRMANEIGGITVISDRNGTKQELYAWMLVFLAGMAQIN